MDDDHEASSSSTTTSKYFQPRWCPSGLICTQKRKLQCLLYQKKKDQEVEKLKARQFNKCRSIIHQSKVWRVKSADQPAGPVGLPLSPDFTGIADRSDCPDCQFELESLQTVSEEKGKIL